MLDYYRSVGVEYFIQRNNNLDSVCHDENQDTSDIDKCFEYIQAKSGENSANVWKMNREKSDILDKDNLFGWFEWSYGSCFWCIEFDLFASSMHIKESLLES